MKWLTPDEAHRKQWVRARMGATVVQGLAIGWYSPQAGSRALMVSVPGTTREFHLREEEDWEITILPDPLVLPTEPGTVIAIGQWWLVRLRPYEGAPSAWELLPLPTRELADRAKANGAEQQCVYDDAWVLAEAEQEGSFVVVALPVDGGGPR